MVTTLRSPRGKRKQADAPADAVVDAAPADLGGRVRIGVELDGTECRVVTVADGQIQGWETFSGTDSADALAQWAKRVRTGNAQVRIVWSNREVNFSRVSTVEEVSPEAQRATLMELAEKEAGTQGTTGVPLVAGVYLPPVEGSSGSPVALAMLNEAHLDPIWEVIGGNPWSVIPAAFIAQPDGLHLAVNTSGILCYVVEGGQTRVYTELMTGGLAELSDKLGIDPAEQAATGSANIHIEGPGQAVLRGYLQQIVTETNRWLVSWVNGHHIQRPHQIWLHGPGAQLPHLAGALIQTLGLGDAPMDAESVTPTLGIGDRSAVPANQTATAYMACRAALATVEPTAVLTNPVQLVMKAKAKERAARQKMLAAISACVVLVVLALAVPLVLAYNKDQSAVNNYNNAVAQQTALSSQFATYTAVHKGQAAERAVKAIAPDFLNAQKILSSTAPPNTTFSSLVLTDQNGGIAVQSPVIIQGAQSFSDIASWIDALKAADATNINIGSFNYQNGSQTFNLQLTLPAQPVSHKG